MMQGIRNTTSDTFRRLLGNGLKYEIPKYQRDYSWGIEEWSDLWYDIQQMISEKDSHYMGYLVLQTNDDKNYKVIDGQQRLTSICILLLAVINYLKSLGATEEEKKRNGLRADSLLKTYIGNFDALTLTSENKIKLNRNNDYFYKTYLSALQPFPLRGLNASEKLMKEAFETFSEYLKSEYKLAEQLISFVDKVVDSLFFTVITVSDELNAFKVFETLNARGVQLSSSDLLKNYFFSIADNEELHGTQIDNLEELWAKISDILKGVHIDDYLRVYWNSTHKTIRKNQLYKTIREEIKTPEQAFELLRDMRAKADIFTALHDPDDELWNDKPEIKENLKLLKMFNVAQPIALLMIAHSSLSESQFSSLLSKLVVVSFRYNVICGKSSYDQEAVYNKMALKIQDEGRLNVEELKANLYISDPEFEQAFAYKEFSYHTRNNKIARYILSCIEHFESSADIDYNNSTLEHILPESPEEKEWDWDEVKIQQFHYRLGNMTLLEYGKNKGVENKSFKTKKQVYAESTVPMTQKIAEYDEWTSEFIESRQKMMAKEAKGIWKF